MPKNSFRHLPYFLLPFSLICCFMKLPIVLCFEGFICFFLLSGRMVLIIWNISIHLLRDYFSNAQRSQIKMHHIATCTRTEVDSAPGKFCLLAKCKYQIWMMIKKTAQR